MNNKFDTAVIGGGIIGLFSAYFLNKEGQKVLVIDKGPPPSAASHGNCGLVTPSHVVPLNELGLIKKAFNSFFQKDAPFFLRPQLDGLFIKWCLQFLRNASEKKFQRNAWAMHHLLQSSKPLYQAIIEEEKLDCNWTDQGIHFVFKTKKKFDAYAKTNEQTKEFNIAAKPFDRDALLEDEPSLRDDLHGSWFYEMDAWLRPDHLVKELKRVLQESGVTIVSDTEINKVHGSNGELKSVCSSQGETFEAQNYVLATGAWTPLLRNLFGFKVPIIPGKGYSITMKSPEITPKRPVIMMEKSVVATPWDSGYRLGSTMELAGYNETMNKTRLDALKRASKEYLKDPYTEEVYEEWFGWRPMTWDCVPVIAKSPKHSNLFVAAGHGMLGISMGPATGKLVSEQILQKEPHLDQRYYEFK